MLSLEASSMDIKSSFTETKLGDHLQLINNCIWDPKPMTIEAKSFHGLEGSSVPTPVMGIAECFLTFPVACFLHYELVSEYRVSPEASGDRLEEKDIELIGLSVTKIALFQIIRFQERRDELMRSIFSVGSAEVISISISLVSNCFPFISISVLA